MKNISVILVNWNGLEYTLRCIESLKRMKHDKYHLNIVVVDNASDDNSAGVIRNKYPDVKLIINSKNSGFSGGNNLGIKSVMDVSDYIWLLNNDTFVAPQAMDKLAESVEADTATVAGSKIFFAPGHEYHTGRYAKNELGKVIWYAGGIIDWNNMYASHRGVDEVDHGQYDNQTVTDFVSGCSLMTSVDLLKRIGFLDERLFMYMEDLEFCLRAKNSGAKIRFVPGSVVWHINAASTSGPGNKLHEYYLTRNRLVVGLKFAPVRTKFALLREAAGVLTGSNRVKRKAVFDALTGRLGGRYLWKKQTGI